MRIECWDAGEVVILRVWTHGFVDPMDHTIWKVIGHEPLRFCRTRGQLKDTAKGVAVELRTGTSQTV